MSKSLPTVTSSIPRDLRTFVDRLREIINGGGVNKLVSAGDLVDAGIANLSATGNLSAAVAEPTLYGPPPAPTTVAAAAAIQNVIVTWDAPVYPGHSHAEIWGSSTNDIGTAVVLGLSPGAVYTDPLGPSKTRYYWVRFVNVQDLAGPYNDTVGVGATTGSDVSYLLTTLAGQISTTELATALNTRLNKIETNETAITTEATTRANADSALSTSITTLTASVGTNTAAIATEATTRANADNSLYAQYTVKLDVNGYVSGFGLASTLNNATPYSNFIFKADQFAFGAPNQNTVYPFVIQTTQTTVNGVTVPAGVYIDAAYIKNGTITNAKIGNAAIDDAKIANLSADKINAGTIGADRITSTVVNAKVTNIDAAVIQSGFIDAARINTASISNANIGTAQITSGTIAAARINSASIADAVVSGSFTFSVDANNYLKIDGPNQRIDVYSGGVLRVRLGKL